MFEHRHSKLGPSIDQLVGGALFDNKGSSNQEVAELITNKQWPSYQLTAIIYYVYIQYWTKLAHPLSYFFMQWSYYLHQGLWVFN